MKNILNKILIIAVLAVNFSNLYCFDKQQIMSQVNRNLAAAGPKNIKEKFKDKTEKLKSWLKDKNNHKKLSELAGRALTAFSVYALLKWHTYASFLSISEFASGLFADAKVKQSAYLSRLLKEEVAPYAPNYNQVNQELNSAKTKWATVAIISGLLGQTLLTLS